MIITVFGATGQVGKRIVEQALAQQHIVRAFGRNIDDFLDKESHTPNLKAIKGYIFDAAEVLQAVQGADVVLSTLGGAFDGSDHARSLGIKNIVTQMETAHVKRIVALGGMGVLDDGKGDYLVNDKNYPAEYLPVGREHLQAYLYLKDSNLDWTFVCSPDILNEAVTGNYITEGERVPSPNQGKIAAGDLAHFMLAEAVKNQYVQHRVGISTK